MATKEENYDELMDEQRKESDGGFDLSEEGDEDE